MSFGLTELGCQEGLDEVPSHSRPYRPATHAKDVHVIILDPLPGREVLMDQRRADTRNLVGTDRRPYAAAADCDAAIDRPPRHPLTERDDKIWIVIVQVWGVRAEIDDLMAGRAKQGDQFHLQAEPAVIGG